MKTPLLTLALLVSLAACAVPETQFIPSRKSAVELRAMQARIIDVDADTAMRGVIATLHDLGYRITRVEPEARTVSATRQTTLRMAVVVQQRQVDRSTVRANATIVSPLREAQVDAPEFYQRNFFEPLSTVLGRMPVAVPEDGGTPEAIRPVAEVNTGRERDAAMRARAAPVLSSASATGPVNP